MTTSWFRQKRIGFGATPNTWQGWSLTMGLILAMLLTKPLVFAVFGESPLANTISIVAILVLVAAYCLLAYFKTEGGWRWRWRWGERSR